MAIGIRACWPGALWAAIVALVAGLAVGAPVPAGARTRTAHMASGCGGSYPAHRDHANPLLLPQVPGSNPLNGARFFVDGPRHGPAAGIIASLLGQVNEMVQAVGRHPVVFLLEIDAIGSSSCTARHHSLHRYLHLFGYEIRKVTALPHAVVYAEAGDSDANSPRYTARALRIAGIRGLRGFFTNDTHENWTIKEVRWARRVSRLTGGLHFIVNTAQNGQGPKLNPHRSTQGVEDLCNPPGRGLGPRPTTHTGFRLADAWLWTHEPGSSSGHCGGGPPSGTFWPVRAIALAARANGRLGPGYPSQPY